jgi:hypothetical protein
MFLSENIFIFFLCITVVVLAICCVRMQEADADNIDNVDNVDTSYNGDTAYNLITEKLV